MQMHVKMHLHVNVHLHMQLNKHMQVRKQIHLHMHMSITLTSLIHMNNCVIHSYYFFYSIRLLDRKIFTLYERNTHKTLFFAPAFSFFRNPTLCQI